MVKSILKEIMIILLLIVVIILLLGILFYDFIPSSKSIPTKVQEYALEADVKTELEDGFGNTGSEEIIKTYQIDATDLEHYEKTNDYNKGKVNPFEQYSTQTSNENTNTNDNSTSGGNTTGGGNNANGNNNTNNDSQGPFLNTVGK